MLTVDDVRQKLREVCREAGSENAWAKANGVSQAYVNDTIRGRREPGASILRALGLERVIQYRRAKA
jgi:DNA-binding transcriptional regulator YdaS (Cro superfamily)